MKKWKSLIKMYPWVVLFALFLFGYMILDLTHTDRARSELENRPLSMRPKLSWNVLMSGSYDEKYDKYINDQFIGRDAWITLKSWTESLLMKTENNGVIYGKDAYLFSAYPSIDMSRYEPNMRYLCEFFEKYPDLSFTLAIVPNAYEVLTEKLPYGSIWADEEAALQQLYSRTESMDNVEILDLFTPLRAKKEEYIYYRTDHHWTTLGAYYAAESYASKKGLVLPPYESMRLRQIDDFYGTNFSKAKKVGTLADTITYYDATVESVTINGEEKSGLYDEAQWKVRDKYAAFLWGNNNFTTILSGTGKNTDPGKNTRVLLIKDSFGNCFAPFLTELYGEVDVIDLRYVNKMSPYLQGQEYDDIIILYNFESLATDGYLATLRY